MSDQQNGWRWCKKCQGFFFAGHSTQGVCPTDNQAHDASQSGRYAALFFGRGEHPERQSDWYWCKKCEGMFHSLGFAENGTCPADNGAHDASESAGYAMILGDDAPGQQGGWRWCKDCEGMFFAGNQSQGACPVSPKGQAGWRWCKKCQGFFFAGHSTQGVCPADNQAHDASQSGQYMAVSYYPLHSHIHSTTVSAAMALWCSKCEVMFYPDGIQKTGGVCPVDHQAHDGGNSGKYEVFHDNSYSDSDEEYKRGKQGDWQVCNKCRAFFFSGNQSHGICPADYQAHEMNPDLTGSEPFYMAFDGILPHDASESGHYAMRWEEGGGPVTPDSRRLVLRLGPSQINISDTVWGYPSVTWIVTPQWGGASLSVSGIVDGTGMLTASLEITLPSGGAIDPRVHIKPEFSCVIEGATWSFPAQEIGVNVKDVKAYEADWLAQVSYSPYENIYRGEANCTKAG